MAADAQQARQTRQAREWAARTAALLCLAVSAVGCASAPAASEIATHLARPTQRAISPGYWLRLTPGRDHLCLHLGQPCTDALAERDVLTHALRQGTEQVDRDRYDLLTSRPELVRPGDRLEALEAEGARLRRQLEARTSTLERHADDYLQLLDRDHHDAEQTFLP